MTIRSKLILIFLGFIILPTLIGMVTLFSNLNDVVRDIRISQLENIVDLERSSLDTFFLERKNSAKLFQANLNMQENLSKFLKYSGKKPGTSYSRANSRAKKRLREIMKNMYSTYGYSKVMLLDTRGKILLVVNQTDVSYKIDDNPSKDSSDKLSDKQLSDKLSNQLSNPEINAFKEGLNKIYFSGIDKELDDYNMHCAAPLYSSSNNLLGVIIFEINVKSIFDFLRSTTGLGNTGETFIGIPHSHEKKIEFINPFHLDRNKTILAKDLIKEKIALPMIHVLLENQNGSGESIDYLGHKVLAAWRKVPSVGWGIVAKIDSSEAFSQVAKLKKRSLVAGLFIILFYITALFLLSKSILFPLSSLQKGMEIVGRGQLGHRVGTKSNDEIGRLSRDFDLMSKNLQQITASRDELNKEILVRKKAEEEISKLNKELELRVIERTAKLEESNKELEAFSYSVSHDLRAPLRHIQGFVEILTKNLGPSIDVKSQRHLLVINNAAIKMGELIDDLLMFSRMGRAEIQLTKLNLEKLISTLIQDMHLDTEERNIEWKIHSPMPVIYCDPSMIRIVMTNLISNALKFTKYRQHSIIEIGIKMEKNNETIFFVKDNGVGFDMQYVNKLFGVFQRLHKIEEFEGTGIGLANVKRIINRHGGKIWAEGILNEGATIYFTLPNQKITEGENERT
ncbi:MAG: HAMP domain-containing protein [Oligoflexia bacterium]|nr:HAMP domain-containing protein [Oligoflexia bacterium]